jgi:hypothetical protein
MHQDTAQSSDRFSPQEQQARRRPFQSTPQRAANDSYYKGKSRKTKRTQITPVTAEQHFQSARQHFSLAVAAYRTAVSILARRALRWVLWRATVTATVLIGLWVSYAAPATG